LAIDEALVNHFEKLLNRPPPPNELLDISTIAFLKLDINTETTLDELLAPAKKLKTTWHQAKTVSQWNE